MSGPQMEAQRIIMEHQDELTELLRIRLIESGWRDQVTKMCRNIIQSKGVDNVRLQDIINSVTPEARNAVPDRIKGELLERIRGLISQTNNNTNS
ncbi:Transcription and mRNA export factor ENY2, partial [Fragariocoptes setiger]